MPVLKTSSPSYSVADSLPVLGVELPLGSWPDSSKKWSLTILVVIVLGHYRRHENGSICLGTCHVGLLKYVRLKRTTHVTFVVIVRICTRWICCSYICAVFMAVYISSCPSFGNCR